MSTENLRRVLNDDHVVMDAIAMFKVGMDRGDKPIEAFRKAMVAMVMIAEGIIPPSPRAKIGSHDERVALANGLMRKAIAPSLPPGEGALLLVFETERRGLLTYISNCERDGCRSVLRELLAKWDSDAESKGQR